MAQQQNSAWREESGHAGGAYRTVQRAVDPGVGEVRRDDARDAGILRSAKDLLLLCNEARGSRADEDADSGKDGFELVVGVCDVPNANLNLHLSQFLGSGL